MSVVFMVEIPCPAPIGQLVPSPQEHQHCTYRNIKRMGSKRALKDVSMGTAQGEEIGHYI